MDEDRLARETRFRRLYLTHKSALRAYAWRRAPDAADDIVAETFTIAWQHLESAPADPLPWLLGIARNVHLGQQRADRRRRAREQRCADTDIMPPFTGAIEERFLLRSALAKLSERDREILLLAAWERLDRSGLATALDCSIPTVTVRLFRARRRLAAALATTDLATDPSPTGTRGGIPDEC